MGYQALLIALSSLLIVALVPPLAWHIKCRNTPAIFLIFWLLLSSIKILVDAAIWGGDNFEKQWDGRIWCDIMIRIQVGTDSGVVCAITAIVLNLFLILLANEWTIAWFSSSLRKFVIEVCICLLTPVFVMGTNYIIMSRRYLVLKYAGCSSVDDYSWVSVVLMTMWPLIWSVIAFIFSVITIMVYLKRRKDVRDILKTTESGLNFRKFARLLVFCILIIMVMFPISIYIFVTSFEGGTESFNWSNVHSPLLWNIISFFDIGVPFDRWITCALSYITFFVFGLGQEAVGMYKNFLRSLGLGYIIDEMDRFYEVRKTTALNTLKGKFKRQEVADSPRVEWQSVSIYDKQSSYQAGTVSIPKSSSASDKSMPFANTYEDERGMNSIELGDFEAEQYYEHYLMEDGFDDYNSAMGAAVVYSIDDHRGDIC